MYRLLGNQLKVSSMDLKEEIAIDEAEEEEEDRSDSDSHHGHGEEF